MSIHGAETVVAGEAEAAGCRRLQEALAEPGDGLFLAIGSGGEPLPVPASIRALLEKAVRELALGNAVTITSTQADLTTQQAADLLRVSRPFLVKLLEAGEIPYYHVGKCRRVSYQAVMTYRLRRSQVGRGVFEESEEALEGCLPGTRSAPAPYPISSRRRSRTGPDGADQPGQRGPDGRVDAKATS